MTETSKPSDPRPTEVRCTCSGPDLTLPFIALLFLAALAFGVGTRAGNRIMCEEGWAPTFIDCAALPPERAE